MPSDTRWAVAMMKSIRWMRNMACQSCHWWKRGLAVQSSSLVPVARATPSLAGTRSLKLARSDRPRLRYSYELATARRLVGCLRWSERLLCPLSCRWRSDWLPCHPSLTIGGIRDRRFHFLPLRTTSSQDCVLKRATSATVADMRRRPLPSIRWTHLCRRLLMN